MAAAKFVIIDGELDFELGSNTYLIEKETSAIAAIIAAMLFLWALMFMNIADLRQWLQKRSRTLKSIANMMDEIEKNAVQTEFSKRIVRKYNAIDGVQESAPSADFFGYFTVDNFLSSEISCGGRMSIAGSRAGSFTRIRALSSQVNSTSEYTYEDGKQIKISSALSSEDNNSYGNALFRGDLLHDSSHRASFNRKSQPSLQVSTISNSSSKANINPNALINSRSNSIEKMSIGNRSTSLPNICSHTAENLNMSVTSNYDVATHSNVNRDLTPLSENISDSHDDGRVVPSLILLPRNVTHTLRIPKIFSSLRIAPIKTSPHTPESFDSIRKS